MHRQHITGVILAGGRARRMGGTDKGLVEVAGKPLVAHVVERLKPQVADVIINANRNLSTYKLWADTVVEDVVGDYAGPLAGMASGLKFAHTELALTVPCDSPLVTSELASRMWAQLKSAKADIAVASDGNRVHPVFVLLKTQLYDSIIAFLSADQRKIDLWFEQHALTVVDFSDQAESFSNINTVEERDALADQFSGSGVR